MIIGITGYMRSGKDSVAKAIIKHRNTFERIGFADQLKELALKVDPVIPVLGSSKDVAAGQFITTARLSQIVRWSQGWESAKDTYPEVRRFLQHLGTGVREVLDEGAWVGAWEVAAQPQAHPDVVVPDVRFSNEAGAIKWYRGVIIRVVRPSVVSTDTHPSETGQDGIIADYTVANDGTLADLEEQVADILDKLGI